MSECVLVCVLCVFVAVSLRYVVTHVLRGSVIMIVPGSFSACVGLDVSSDAYL